MPGVSSGAGRGWVTACGWGAVVRVGVTGAVPVRGDLRLARLAGQPHKGELLESGVRIVEFGAGILHTKSVTIDGELSLFGSLNLEPRSLVLHFAITHSVYDRAFPSA